MAEDSMGERDGLLTTVAEKGGETPILRRQGKKRKVDNVGVKKKKAGLLYGRRVHTRGGKSIQGEEGKRGPRSIGGKKARESLRRKKKVSSSIVGRGGRNHISRKGERERGVCKSPKKEEVDDATMARKRDPPSAISWDHWEGESFAGLSPNDKKERRVFLVCRKKKTI